MASAPGLAGSDAKTISSTLSIVVRDKATLDDLRAIEINGLPKSGGWLKAKIDKLYEFVRKTCGLE